MNTQSPNEFTLQGLQGETDRSMIQYHVDEDLFAAPTQTIVIPVNTQGVMGKGLARRYPEMFQHYRSECQSGRLRIGRPTLFKGKPWILNFPTREQPQDLSTLEYIERSLSYLVTNYQKGNITSLAFPKVGCGQGGLSWQEVGPVLVRALRRMEIPMHIYLNKGDAQYQPAAFSPYHIADTLPLGEATLEVIEGTADRMMIVRDLRFIPSIYYVCLGRKVYATTVHEKWAQLLYTNYQK